MSGLLANLVGVATAALNLRSQDSPVRAPKNDASEGNFASALSAALTPRQRAEVRTAEEARETADAARAAEDEGTPGSAAEGGAGVAGAASAAAGSAGGAAETAGAAGADTSSTASVAGAAGAMSVASAAGANTTTHHAAKADGTAAADAVGEAASERAVAGPGPARRNPTAVTSSLEGLSPEFRARLERVIARMEQEHGHDVRIVETVRDQARQNYLFEQGRSRPGQVVTWTRSSNHTQGRAADLIVDGTYDNPLAMVRLARIAREEGLRTLGSKDPGHVELPAGVRVERMALAADATTSLLDSGTARAAEAVRAATVAQPQPQGAGGMPGIARVAQVARVGQVAQVATVARVATPGPIGGGAAVEAPAAPGVAPEQAPAAIPGQLASSGGNPAGDDGRREGRSSNHEPVKEASGDASPRVTTGNPFGLESRSGTAMAAEVRGAPASFGAEAAERIARVLALQDSAPTRPLSQMVLRLDNPMGGEDRIRVDLRGSSVGAALNVSDPVTAARLQSELGQLQRALEGRGLQAEHLSVSAAAGREVVEALRTPVPSEQGQRTSQDSSSQREGWNGRSGGRRQDADSEQPQQRPRKNFQQERNT